MTPEEYGRMTGRSANDIRNCFLPEGKRSDPDARLRIRIDTTDMIDGITDICDSEKEMTKPNNILKESYYGCLWMKEMNREQKRNAQIRNNRKLKEQETDIPEEAVCELKRIKAHEKRREKRQTKNRWIELAGQYAKEATLSSEAEKEEIRRYLQTVREKIDELDKKPKEKSWVRTEKPVLI